MILVCCEQKKTLTLIFNPAITVSKITTDFNQGRDLHPSPKRGEHHEKNVCIHWTGRSNSNQLPCANIISYTGQILI
jgi:hypothetical protein